MLPSSAWCTFVSTIDRPDTIQRVRAPTIERHNAVPRERDPLVEAARPGPALPPLVDRGQEPGDVEDQGEHEPDPRLRGDEFRDRRFEGEPERPVGEHQGSAAARAHERELRRAGKIAVAPVERGR